MLNQVGFNFQNIEIKNNNSPIIKQYLKQTGVSKDIVEFSGRNEEQKPKASKLSLLIGGLGAGFGAAGVAIATHKTIALRNIENGFKTVFTDLRESTPKTLKEMLDKLTGIATTDKLTGLFNRRKYDANVATLFEKAKNNGENLHLAIVDFDNFKGINEMLHHTTGDVFLQLIADNAKKVAEKHGIAPYRYGGEEFILLMSSKDKKAAKAITEELAKNINADPRLKAYLDTFLSKANERVSELRKKQALTQAYYDFKHKVKDEALERTEGLKFLNEHVDQLSESVRDKVKAEIRDIETKNLENASIFHCINQHFHHIREINQIEDWISHVNKVVNGEAQGFTISGGVAEFSAETMKTPKDLLKHADKLLDQSKKVGKATVSVD